MTLPVLPTENKPEQRVFLGGTHSAPLQHCRPLPESLPVCFSAWGFRTVKVSLESRVDRGRDDAHRVQKLHRLVFMYGQETLLTGREGLIESHGTTEISSAWARHGGKHTRGIELAFRRAASMSRRGTGRCSVLSDLVEGNYGGRVESALPQPTGLQPGSPMLSQRIRG